MEVARASQAAGDKRHYLYYSSTEHAMDSYNVDALYYLQKPFTHEHFLMAMQRCEALIQKAQKNSLSPRRAKSFRSHFLIFYI